MTKYTHKKISAKLAAKAAKTGEAGDDVSPEVVSELKSIGEGIRSLGRRTTEQSFELGGYLARAKAILPERAFGAWVKAICKFTPKSARNYIAVHENLAVQKERLVAAGTSTTTLFVLAYADQDKVEDVLAAIEAGEQLTVAQVKRMLGVPTDKKASAFADSLNMGGLAGLRKVANLKIEQDAARFLELTAAILVKVEKALEPLSQNRAVRKGALHDAVMYDCRHAHDLINSLAAPLKPDVTAYLNWRPEKLPDGTNWRKVQALLYRMGGAEDWPDRASFVPWLQNTVVPLLRFVVHGEELASEEEDLIVDAENTDAGEDEGLLSFDHMPPAVQATVRNAIESVASKDREFMKSRIFFDTKPANRRAA